MPNSQQPQTLSHEFELTPLRTHFIKSPNPPGANALIDLPPTDYLPTEEEFNVVAAALWTLCVEYDQIEEEKRPKHRDALRSWIIRHRDDVLFKLTNKIEPPFTHFSVTQMQQDVAALSDELLAQTLPADKREPGNKPHISAEEQKSGDDDDHKDKDKDSKDKDQDERKDEKEVEKKEGVQKEKETKD